MSSIDSRVVEAKFDNKQFETGIKTTLDSLDQLKKGLQLNGATKGLKDVDDAAKRMDLSHIANSVDGIASHFTALGMAASVAFGTIVSRAASAATSMLKSFSFGPITDGLAEYETNLNSIQTILSNTQWQGATLDQVNGALQELNLYSDKTIYNFSEMARNIGTFTSAGVKLDTSVNAIKGIANLAAVSGSSADQASTAMYQLSQALASGTVKLMDWNSVVNAGMGGKVFQDSLKETARIHGVKVDEMIKKDGSFRDSLKEGWLTSQILTETLSKFTGDLNAQQLKSMGYSKEQAAQIIKMGKTATDAATKIKTFHQLINTVKESMGSGWTQTWQLIFGDFGEAKTMWTNVYNVLNGMVGASANARNKMLGDWKALGGRTVLIDAISTAFHELMDIVHAVTGAFREVFPRKTGSDLVTMTIGFSRFIDSLKMGAKTLDNLKRTLAGFFAILDIGWQIVKAGIHFIADLFGMITKGEGSGGFLGMTANIGDFLVALDKAIKKGDGLTKFFHGLEHILAGPIRLIKELADALFNLFDFKAPSATSITKAFTPMESLGHAIIAVWDKVISILGKVFHAFEPLANKFADFFSSIGGVISDALGGINYEDVLHTINTGLFAGLVLLVRKMVNIFKGGAKAPQGFLDSLMSPFRQLTGTLKTMQSTLRATTLLQIAAAVGILAASTVALSKIDAAGLTRALTAMTVMFGQLFTSMIIFDKIGGVKGIGTTAAALILFATAIRILASSVKALSDLSWNDLAKGLIGVSVLIGGLTVAVRGMSGETGGMLRAGAGLMILAIGIKILASAVAEISTLSWGEIAKGLTGVGALLLSLTLFTKFADANKGGVLQSAGLVLLGTAIKILASAVQDFAAISWEGIGKGLGAISAVLLAVGVFSKTVGNPASLLASGAALVLIAAAMDILAAATGKFAALSWGEIAKGLVSMGGALLIISAALNTMPPISSLPSAVALVAIGGALLLIAQAVTTMAGMSWEEIAKGLVTLAGALTIISVAMDAMTFALPGAAALVVVAGALAILTPILVVLGSMSWEEIAKGLITLAGAFAILGLAGLILTPVVPTLLGLGVAITLLGVGVALIGGGVLLLATGLTALAAAGGAVTLAIVAMVSAILGILPVLVKEVGLLIVALAEAIAVAAPSIGKAVTAVVLTILKVIRDTSPQILRTFGQLLVNLLAELANDVPKMAASALKMFLGILKALEKNEPAIIAEMIKLLVGLLNALASGMPKMTAAAANLMVKFLDGIAAHVGEVITAGTNIIIAFIKGIGKNAVRIANAAMDTVVDFINGLADAINSHTDDFRNAGLNMAGAIINGLTFGLASKVGGVVKGAVNIGKSAVHGIGSALGIGSPSKEFCRIGKMAVQGFINGIEENIPKVNKVWRKIDDVLDEAERRSIDRLKDARNDLLKLTLARDKDTEAIKRATAELLKARKEYDKISNLNDEWTGKLSKERYALEALNLTYDYYNHAIKEANKNLKDAIKTKDDFFSSVKDQYGNLPDISQETDLQDYINQLQYQINDNKKFMQVLFQLHKLGLNDTMYKELLSQGTKSLPLAEQILAGGQDAIKQINDLDGQLSTSVDRLGMSTGFQLEMAGIREAKRIRDRLVAQQKGLVEGMKYIGRDMQKTLADALKFTPPVIKETTQGLRSLLLKLPGILKSELELHPKIIPVLDLSEIKKDYPTLTSLFERQMSLRASTTSATDASAAYNANAAAKAEPPPTHGGTAPGVLSFTQNNYSPKALSSAELYRMTRNQLSLAKGALTPHAA